MSTRHYNGLFYPQKNPSIGGKESSATCQSVTVLASWLFPSMVDKTCIITVPPPFGAGLPSCKPVLSGWVTCPLGASNLRQLSPSTSFKGCRIPKRALSQRMNPSQFHPYQLISSLAWALWCRTTTTPNVDLPLPNSELPFFTTTDPLRIA